MKNVWFSVNCLLDRHAIGTTSYADPPEIRRRVAKEFLGGILWMWCFCGKAVLSCTECSDELSLEYLYRLNVDGIRAKIPVKEGYKDARSEHVEHFIETLDNR